MATAGDYRWIHDSLDDAACVTVVVGKDSEGVLLAFNADPSLSVPIDESDGYASGRAYVSVLDVPGAVIAVEYNGFQGSLPEVLGAASSEGRAASMFWNVNDDNAFSCAAEGEILASVDMYDAEDPEDADELPEDLTPLFVAAGASDADLHATGLAMVEEFTGIRVTPEHLASVTVAHPIIGER
jgi:hypothetical protein